jgi:hypothetical protein
MSKVLGAEVSGLQHVLRQNILSAGAAQRLAPPGSSLMVVLRAEGERVEEFARIRHDGVPALPPASDPDAPTFTLRQHFVLNRIAEAHGMTALEMFGDCPPPPRTFLDRLGDLYEAMARGDDQHVASCLSALEAAADPTLRLV